MDEGYKGMEAVNSLFTEYESFLTKEIMGTDGSVRESAQNLVNHASNLIKMHQGQEAMRKRLAQITENNGLNVIREFNQKMVTSQQEYKEIMSLVFKLQNEVQKFLGQQLEMIMVWIGSHGQVELYRTDNNMEHISVSKRAPKKGGGIIGRYTKGLRQGKRVILEGYDPVKAGLDPTFEEIYFRAQISKNRIKAGGALWIFWSPPAWQGVKVTGMGVLGEAYGTFYFAEEVFNAAMEENIGHFMTGSNGKSGALGVDTKSGFLEGDSSSKDNSIQYGFKANGASAMGYAEIIQYAQEMIEATDLRAYLEDLRKKLDAIKTPLAWKVDNCIDAEYALLLKDLEKHIESLLH